MAMISHQNKCFAKLQKNYGNQYIASSLFCNTVKSYVFVGISNANNRQSVNPIVREAENHVITFKKNGKRELWHDDCIFPNWKMSETAFLALLQTEGCKKTLFLCPSQKE